MDSSHVPSFCPVCAGPVVRAAGRGHCVICGFGLRPIAQPRRRPARILAARRVQRPRQLLLPITP